MKPGEFCYWLQGFLEMAEPKTLSASQVKMLKAHLDLVFAHVIDPSYVVGLPKAEAQAKMEHLQALHDQGKSSAQEDEQVERPRPPRIDPHLVLRC